MESFLTTLIKEELAMTVYNKEIQEISLLTVLPRKD
jgi:hypothetical protein